MNRLWKGIAFATVASFAMGSTGCDAIKKLIGPRMDKPTIGTRTSAIASLDVKDSTDKAKYLGCDIKYWNMPAGAKIKLVWHVYDDADGDGKADDDDPINKTSGKEQDVQGNGMINAYLQSLDGDFHPGVYECKWEAITSKTVEGGEQVAKIKVGDGKNKKKKKGGDDDDGDKKKKKKKGGDDDE